MQKLQEKIDETFTQMLTFPKDQWKIFDEKIERLLETCPYCRNEYRVYWSSLKAHYQLKERFGE